MQKPKKNKDSLSDVFIRIFNTPNTRLDELIISGTIEERVAIAAKGYRVDELAKDATPMVRIQALLGGADATRMVFDPSHQVRFAAVNELEKKLFRKKPRIEFDANNNPYVISSPEREALQEFACDISPVVHIRAAKALDKVKEIELKEAITILLKRYGMVSLAESLGMNINNSLIKKMLGKELTEIPTDKEIKRNRLKKQEIYR